jgi:hypothetical protein
METKNWLVSYYDINKRILTTKIIENRTEFEAINESTIDVPECTYSIKVIPIKSSIKKQ